jgi:hypothetical protein
MLVSILVYPLDCHSRRCRCQGFMLQLRRSFTLLRRQYMPPLRKWFTPLLRLSIALRPLWSWHSRCLSGAPITATATAIQVITVVAMAATVAIGAITATVDIIAINFPRYAGGKFWAGLTQVQLLQNDCASFIRISGLRPDPCSPPSRLGKFRKSNQPVCR